MVSKSLWSIYSQSIAFAGTTLTRNICHIPHDMSPFVSRPPPAYLVLNPASGGALEEKYTVVNVTKSTILEEVEVSRAMFELYEGGVVSSLSLSVISSYAAPLASFCTKAQLSW